jgi:malonyl CoA-acyl carrier protein transacylase
MTALLLGTNPNKGIVPISSSTNSHKESTVRSVLKTVELLREHYQQQQQALQASSNSTIFSIAGINSPQQIVVSGHTNTLSSVIHSFTNQFAASSPLLIKRSVKLNVSAPFHSSLFTATPKHISQALIVDGKEDTSNTLRARIVSPTIPYIANIHGNSLQQPNDIKDALVQNITSPVRWLESLHTVVHQTMESKINSSLLFLELGTGNTLTGLLKQTFPSTTATLPQPMNENTDKPSSGTSIPSISGRSIGTVKEIQEFVQLIEQSLR